MDFIFLSLAIAAAGYFIGDGLKNFQNPNAKNILEAFDFEDDPQLIKERDVHLFIGISKEDAKQLLNEYPDIPHIKLNHTIYYPKEKLREWLKNVGEE
ncbi:hypothetical protein [Halalkalibacter krulwichiae]|uniref:DNA-binding protein n=1 Tax=Halalkalibacter krulwichiae TaxID=199441 RepID=A0A1X9MN12_9BACI|nr:hypothetical protein [Halalkalibacter krulwichiae]ARK32692.1 hypothetical protein BkAM31D_24115 [Halalkalibacter krulwichiae]